MIRRPLLLAALGLAILAPAARRPSTSRARSSSATPTTRTLPAPRMRAAVVAPRTRVVRTRPGPDGRPSAPPSCAAAPASLSATPNLIARAAYIPNDPGRSGVPGGWQELQWNFVGPFGVNAPAAWDHTGEAGRLGGAGVVVAVLDTGVAYADHGGYARSPDLRGNRFVAGRDFVDGDGKPDDENGHGTHVASTDRRDDRQRRRRHRPRLRRADHAGARARPLGRGRQRRRSRRASASPRARASTSSTCPSSSAPA